MKPVGPCLPHFLPIVKFDLGFIIPSSATARIPLARYAVRVVSTHIGPHQNLRLHRRVLLRHPQPLKYPRSKVPQQLGLHAGIVVSARNIGLYLVALSSFSG